MLVFSLLGLAGESKTSAASHGDCLGVFLLPSQGALPSLRLLTQLGPVAPPPLQECRPTLPTLPHPAPGERPSAGPSRPPRPCKQSKFLQDSGVWSSRRRSKNNNKDQHQQKKKGLCPLLRSQSSFTPCPTTPSQCSTQPLRLINSLIKD